MSGSYQYLLLGNMLPDFDAATNALYTSRQSSGSPWAQAEPYRNAYYYIDDVSLFAIPKAGPDLNLTCGNQTTPLATLGAFRSRPRQTRPTAGHLATGWTIPALQIRR